MHVIEKTKENKNAHTRKNKTKQNNKQKTKQNKTKQKKTTKITWNCHSEGVR